MIYYITYILIIFGTVVHAYPQQFHNDLKIEHLNNNYIQNNTKPFKDGCSVRISSLTEPQPTFVIDGKLIAPIGNSKSIVFSVSEKVIASCLGRNNGLDHHSTSDHPATATLSCVSSELFQSEWLQVHTKLRDVKCISHSPSLEATDGTCANGRGLIIAVKVQALKETNIVIYKSCFDQTNAAVLYVTYFQTPESITTQKTARPRFKQGEWYPNLSPNSLYTTDTQKSNEAYEVGELMANGYYNDVQKTNIALVVGEAMADVYYKNTYLARGHLAAKADFVLSTEQRATFNYINCVPQWQSFNGGNWNRLENNLRTRISVGNFRTTIYTGSWGVLQLKDSSNELHDIYLSPRAKQIPAPLWLFKVVHDPSTNKATAFLGLNNPFVTLQEAKDLTFCEDKCMENSKFEWLEWDAENINLGFSICCDVNDFRKVVDYLPDFEVDEMFY